MAKHQVCMKHKKQRIKRQNTHSINQGGYQAWVRAGFAYAFFPQKYVDK